MAVYVDHLRPALQSRFWKYPTSAHLIADTVEELHAFAMLLHLRREWFQPKSFPHYDLQDTKHAQALMLGAVLLDRKEFIEVVRRVRSELMS